MEQYKNKKVKHTNSPPDLSFYSASSYLLLTPTVHSLIDTSLTLCDNHSSIISFQKERLHAHRAAGRRQSSIKRWDMVKYPRNRQTGEIGKGRQCSSKPFVQQFSTLLIVSPTSVYPLPLQTVNYGVMRVCFTLYVSVRGDVQKIKTHRDG